MSEQPKYSKGEELMSELSKKFEETDNNSKKAVVVAEMAENEAILNVLKKNKVGDPESMSEEEEKVAIDLSVAIFKACDNKNLIKTKVEAKKLFEDFRDFKGMRDKFIVKLQEELVSSAFTPRQAPLEKLWEYLTDKF